MIIDLDYRFYSYKGQKVMSGRSVLMEEDDMRISREEGIQPILLKFPITD